MNFTIDFKGAAADAVALPAAAPAPAVSPGVPSSLSGFDGANYSTKRGRVFWPTLDTRKELDSYSRNELIRRIRWLHGNGGLIKGIIENAAMFIGWLTPTAITKDDAWNELADDNFSSRTKSKSIFDDAGKFNFATAQGMINECALKDGDILTVLTESPNKGARVAFYESHQIRSLRRKKEDGWIDGVLVNKGLRHLKYSVVADDTATVMEARNCIYYGIFKSVGHNRPVPPLAHAVNNALDIMETRGYIKHGIKAASLFGMVIEQESDAPNNSKKVGGMPALGAETPAPLLGGEGDETPFSSQKAFSGGVSAKLGRGEKAKILNDNRPGPNSREFAYDQMRDIAIGLGLPLEVVYHMVKLTGPGVRFVLQFAEKWIEKRRLELQEWCHRYWAYHMAKEIKAGRLPVPNDPNWIDGVEWTPTRSISIDRSNDKNRMDEMDAGYGTFSKWCADTEGAGWRKKTVQRTTEVKYAYEACGGVWDELTAEQKYAMVHRPRQGVAAVDIPDSKNSSSSSDDDDDE